jgi:PAS domain S-box-containing protein
MPKQRPGDDETDVTRDGAEARALAAEQRFELVVSSIKDYAIFTLDPSGRITSWNRGARLIKGYSADEVIGKDISIFYTAEDRARNWSRALLDAALAEGQVEDEGWRVRKDGSRFWADAVITSLGDGQDGPQGFVKVTRDLTSRRQAEQKLRESEQSLAATLYSIGDAVLAADEQGRVTRINPVAERLTGWTEREAVGRPLEEVFDIINEVTRQKAPNPVTRVLAEGIVVGLANHTSLISRDGTERPIADSGAPILDVGGVTRGAVLVFRDVTAERHAEEERLRLAQAQESVRLRDEFISIASHELKTPLTALQLQLTGILGQAAGADEKFIGKVERARRMGARLSTLIEALLDVSRIATGRLKLSLEPFDLGEAVRDVTERFREAATESGCPLSVNIEGPIVGNWDRIRIEQIVTNLVSNSIKYASGRPIVISAARETDVAVLEVRDGGPGVPEADLSRIFERFGRAASARHYGGLGLGLYVARQIAEAHGGTIGASNLPSGGACFAVRLPLVYAGH